VAVLLWLRRGSSVPSAAIAPAAARDAVRAVQRSVVRDRLLWCYGASYFFIKFIRYSLLFWLPFYLAEVHGLDGESAAYTSVAFEVGGAVGAVSVGLASDRVGATRGVVAAVALLGLAAALVAYAWLSASGAWQNVALLALVGAMLFGPDALLSGAAAHAAGGRDGAAMATGFVNGVGSVGALLEGLLVPRIAEKWGWDALFPVLVGFALLAAVSLLPALRLRPVPR
jgi:sugar phosphate permease